MTDELDPLRKAAKGLLYPSESDAPIEVVSDVAIPTGGSNQTLDEFFAALADSDDAAKFAKLRAAVDATLTDVKVYRVGAINVDVYVLGKTASGAVGGLHTTSVET